MPVDPSISLAVPKGNPMDVAGGAKPSFPGDGQGGNPLSMVEGLAGIQGQLNQLKLFNQTYQARQKAGQIMATAPDIATGVARMAQDPDVSAFAPELANTAAATNNALLEAGGKIQQQGTDAFTNVVKGLPAVLQDPGQWPALVDSTVALASPAARPGLIKSLGYLQESLTAPGADGKPVTQAEQQKRLSGWIIAGGMGDAIPRILNAPGTVTISGTPVPVTITPAQGGVNGEAPGTVTPVRGGGQSQPSPAATGSGPTFQTADGTVLHIGNSPRIGTGVLGMNALSPAQSEAATSRMTEWNGPELHAFQNAQVTQGLLSQMGSDFDTMVRAGGMQVPGAGAGFRSSFVNAINTIYQGLDKKPPFDPTALGAAENLTKNTRTMGLTVLTTMLGNQREAAQTIHDITQAVPSINNSYLGGKILIDTLGAANQRAIDRRNFENAWQARNQGNLQGADESFNEQMPMTEYTDKVLAKYGLGSEGFTSLAALENAAREGYLTPKQAADIAREKKFSIPAAEGN